MMIGVGVGLGFAPTTFLYEQRHCPHDRCRDDVGLEDT